MIYTTIKTYVKYFAKISTFFFREERLQQQSIWANTNTTHQASKGRGYDNRDEHQMNLYARI